MNERDLASLWLVLLLAVAMGIPPGVRLGHYYPGGIG
jgi:hypothetical protein